jgi:site-specific DNA-methyltransferase (adenine-specific)
MIQLIKGDCLVEMQNIPDKSIDAIICDLPYGTTACKWDTIIPFEPLWVQYKRIIKDNGAIVLFGSQPFTSALVMSNPKWFKYEWIWENNRAPNFVFGNKQPLKKHENIIVFYNKQPTYNPQKIKNPKGEEKRHLYKSSATISGVEVNNNTPKYASKGSLYESDMLLPKSLIYFKKPQKPKHPTQKGEELLEYLVKTYTNEGDTVLDNTMGSGTCGVACKNLNRYFIGIEMDDKYFEIAKKRIESHVVQSSF